MYRVIRDFSDLQDHNHVYRAGDTFPRPNTTVSKGRLGDLLSTNNVRKVPIIEELPDVKKDISLAEEKPKETKTGTKSSKASKAKRKQRKGQEEHA